MFDSSLPEVADLASLRDAELVDAARAWSRAENAAAARKLAVMAEIFDRRTALASAKEREGWWVDPTAAVAAELSAALNVSRGMALHQTNRGVALRDRLPKVAALFEAGVVSDLLVRTIVSRTYLIEDDDALAAVDVEVAARVERWGVLSAKKTEAAIDALVETHDPEALRRTVQATSHETVQFGCPVDAPGMTTIWARLNSPDAALMEQNVDQLAHSVCDADPRDMEQRRAHALAAAVNRTAFTCRCGDPGCTGGTEGDAPAKNAVVYVVADEKSVEVALHSDTAAVEEDSSPADSGGTAADPGPRCTTPPAYVFGAGILPTALLGGMLERATIREVRHPASTRRPSRATSRRVRWRRSSDAAI